MTTRGQSPWLFGPVPDLLLGSGLLYFVILATLMLGGEGFHAAIPSRVFIFLILIFSGAHYGATLLRVYEHQAERRTYRTFTVYATLLMCALLVGALHSPLAGSLLITIYLTWSPWHYAGQNYGIALMSMRRRGVEISPLAKQWFYASFLLSFLAVFLNFHFEGGIGQADPLGYTASVSSGYQFLSLDLPGGLRGWLLPAVGIAYLVSIGISGFLLVRAGGWRRIAPAALLVAMQAAWFSIPHFGYFFAFGERIPILNLRIGQNFQTYFVWAALGHAIQYLWITTYYARSDRRWQGYTRYFSKAFVFGNAVWAAPVLLFGPKMLGGVDYDGGLALSVAAAVNLHHFVLDGAIWKLRNPKIAAVLLRRSEGASIPGELTPPSAWTRRVAWSVAGLLCLLKLYPEIDIEARFPAALSARDYPAAEAILDRAAYYGRDSGKHRAELANRLIQERKPLDALPQYWRSLELKPQAEGFAQLGLLTQKRVGVDQALFAWKRGLEEFPEDANLNDLVGRTLENLQRDREALPYLQRAAAALPEKRVTQEALVRVRARLDRLPSKDDRSPS